MLYTQGIGKRMPLSYHWNRNSLQIVCRGQVYMLPADDARYPWALAALSQSEQAVLNVLDGDIPVFLEHGTQWTVSALPDGEDALHEDAWEFIDVFDDNVDACSGACEHLLINTNAERIRVCSADNAVVFSLSRTITLANQ